jgi:hypothetical protein
MYFCSALHVCRYLLHSLNHIIFMNIDEGRGPKFANDYAMVAKGGRSNRRALHAGLQATECEL